MDMTSFSTLLGSIKTATEIAKLIRESDASLEKAESKLKLAELISALADAKIEVTEIQQALYDKDAEVRRLTEQLKVKEKLQWERPYYWLVAGADKDGPFCQHCYDKGQELIRLQSRAQGFWTCKACKNNYEDSAYRSSVAVVTVPRHDPFTDLIR